jgi:hypothetical protein
MPVLYRLRVVLFGHLVSPLTKRTATARTFAGFEGVRRYVKSYPIAYKSGLLAIRSNARRNPWPRRLAE